MIASLGKCHYPATLDIFCSLHCDVDSPFVLCFSIGLISFSHVIQFDGLYGCNYFVCTIWLLYCLTIKSCIWKNLFTLWSESAGYVCFSLYK